MSAEDTESPRSKWHENHGNFLLGFVAFVLVVGAGLVVYRQNRSHSSTSPPNVSPRPAVISVGSDDTDDTQPDAPGDTNPAGDTDPAGDTVDVATPADSADTDGGGVDSPPRAETTEAVTAPASDTP